MASADRSLDELKSQVIRTLEGKGVLGEIRALLRTKVYEVIDSEDLLARLRGPYPPLELLYAQRVSSAVSP